MARISQDDLKYCSELNECVDCYSKNSVTTAEKFQTRGEFTVPCCKEHFYAYRNKINEANARKYDERSAVKRPARQCVAPGCHNKLIPQELLPPWIKEITCGTHGAFKAFRVNRIRLLEFIVEHCLTDEERKGTAQNIIYKPKSGFVWFSSQHPAGYYQTKIFSARDLLQRYKPSPLISTLH